MPCPTSEQEQSLEAAGSSHDSAAPDTCALTRVQILVIDEPGMWRDGLCALLQSHGKLEIVAVSDTRRDAVQTLASAQPQIVIMDFSTALKTGPQTIVQLKRRWPELRVVVLTVRRDQQFIEGALRAGADAYVLKTDGRAELFNAIDRISSGKGYISPAALDRMVTAYAGTDERPAARTRPPGVLTSREQEIIALVARGYRTREMAQLLSLSHKTVDKHRTNLMRKLGLRSAAAVAAYAITHGFV